MTHSGNQNNEKKSVKYNSLYANIPSTFNISKGWPTDSTD